MTDSILILGASALQIPLIKFVKSKGYRVVVASIPGNYPGFQLADKCVMCDVRDGDAIFNQIKDDNIVAVLTDQTDIAVPTIAYISNLLGLKANKLETAQAYSNKFLIHQACEDIGLPNMQYIRMSSINDAKDWHLYPAVIKPEDNQGSRGVCLVNSYMELLSVFDAALSFSKTGHVILEEFFVGDEVVVEGFVKDGEYLNWGIGDRKYFELEKLFIPSQTIFPSNISDVLKNKLLDSEKRLHNYLYPSFGMIHSEYLVNSITGEFRLVETALRGGGVYISSHLVPLYCGYNNYELLLDATLGNNIDLSIVAKQMHQKASAYICFYLPEGEIISVEGTKNLFDLRGVVLADITELQIDTHIEMMKNKTQRLGPIIVEADNRSDIEQLINAVQHTLKIDVQCADGNVDGIKWS